MYFDFEDGHPDIEGVPSALTPREGVLLTIIVHLLAILLILVLPQLPYFKRLAAAQAAEAQRLALLRKPPDQTRFVFMQPRVELTPSKPPDRAPMSDRDRRALSHLQAPHPKNNKPFARGNSPEYVEKSPPPQPQQQARQAGPPQPPTPNPAQQNSSSSAQANAGDAFRLPEQANHAPAPRDTTPAGGRPAGGRFTAENLLRYAEQAGYDNPDGNSNSMGPLQFDSKGANFGPWIRKFLAQLKRNWYSVMPQTAMSQSGHVVITFNVHRRGTLTEVNVLQPSVVQSFTFAAANALEMTNPTDPLPTEYPSDHCTFTITFYYNERPPDY